MQTIFVFSCVFIYLFLSIFILSSYHNNRVLILSEQMIRNGGSYSIRIRNDFITTM